MDPDVNLELPSDASPDEAAAITAAVEQWLAAEGRVDDSESMPEEPWTGRRFAFAGRLEKLGREPARVPRGAPADAWTAVDRVGRR